MLLSSLQSVRHPSAAGVHWIHWCRAFDPPASRMQLDELLLCLLSAVRSGLLVSHLQIGCSLVAGLLTFTFLGNFGIFKEKKTFKFVKVTYLVLKHDLQITSYMDCWNKTDGNLMNEEQIK